MPQPAARVKKSRAGKSPQPSGDPAGASARTGRSASKAWECSRCSTGRSRGKDRKSKGAAPEGTAPFPCSRRSCQAATEAIADFRRRMAKPTSPKPVINIAQVAGSGITFTLKAKR